MSKLAETQNKKPMTKRRFLYNQIALLIVVSLFLIDKSMFTCWVRNFFNMLHISEAEPVVMALFAPINAVHLLAPAISQLCLLQIVFIFSYIQLTFFIEIVLDMFETQVATESVSEPKFNDTLENCQFTYKEIQRFLC